VFAPLQAQEDYISEGEKLLKEQKYKEAIYFYKYADIDNNPSALFKRAYCYFKTNNFSKAQKDIIQSINQGNQNPETLFLMGQMKHSESKYKEAITFYKDYLKAVGSDHPSRLIVVEYVKNCNSAINYRFKPAVGTVKNLGAAVNSPYDEISPLTSPNYDNVYYFSSNRKSNKQDADVEIVSYNYDIYRIESTNDNFTRALPINPEMNGIENEVLLDISDDGQILFFSQGFDEKYVYADTFGVVIPEYLERQKMASPFNESSVDYLDVFKDNIFVFASKDMQGYGGYDLYGTMMIEGAWIDPFNLGPQINTIYDEVSPYLAADGTSLYFSSNRIKGIGGYDIYATNYNASKKKWSRAKNMLPPINSDKDDIYFRLHRNGRTGVFSSDRLLNSGGGYDLYQTEMTGGSNITNTNKIVPDFVQHYLDAYQEKEIFIVPNDEIIYSYEDEIYGEEQAQEEAEIPEEEAREYNETPIAVTGSGEGTSYPEEILNFQNRSLFPDKSGDIASERNQLIVAEAARFLMVNPGTNIEIVGHTLKEGLPEYDLYFSIKFAEEIKDLLTSQNIAGDRILLKGLGSAYPLVKYDSGGQGVDLSEKMNKRVEMNLIQSGNSSYRITQEKYDIPDYLRAAESQLYMTLKDGLSYKIQIAETDKLLKNEVLANYKHIMIENTPPDRMYKYTVGMYDNYTETFFIKRELEGYNIENPQVVPYIDGQRIERDKLFILADKYPDLANFIEYEID